MLLDYVKEKLKKAKSKTVSCPEFLKTSLEEEKGKLQKLQEKINTQKKKIKMSI